MRLVLPVALYYDVDPMRLGIVFLANLRFWIFLPPVGMNLFIASMRFDRPILTLVRARAPFFVILLVAVLAITCWPKFSLAPVR